MMDIFSFLKEVGIALGLFYSFLFLTYGAVWLMTKLIGVVRGYVLRTMQKGRTVDLPATDANLGFVMETINRKKQPPTGKRPSKKRGRVG